MKKVVLLSLATAATSVGAFTFSSQAAAATRSARTTSYGIVPPSSSSSYPTQTLMTLHATAADPDEEIATIQRNADATFAVIDVDGGGTLSRAEFTNHLSVSGYNTETIDKIFDKMDVNKDEEISRDEFRNGMVMLAALRTAPGLGSYNVEYVKEIYEDADQVFQSADEDRNGTIDRDELRSHIGRSFANYSEGAIDEIFRCIDVNDDGTITSEEFRDAFLKSSALRQALGEGPNFK